ncbi:OmpA family protein [Heminiphilus faecis]|uniref:OmpA family protein n=1 Tax=Heminiphilus faecis TaxID=2601703 RepID=A0ABV4CUY3_9BACT
MCGLTSLRLLAGTLLMLSLLCSCSTAKLSVADGQMARGEYYDASRTYRKIYNRMKKKSERPLRGEVAFKMGRCYSSLGMNARASVAYRNALRYDYPDSTTLLYLGRSLHAEGKYALAADAYSAYLALSPADSVCALNGLAGCRLVASLKEHPTRYVVRNAKIFNSRRSEFAPMFLDRSGDVLYFTTTNERVTGTLRSEITGMKRSDLWMARKNERGEWMRAEPAEGDINTAHDEGIVSFSPDGHTMYLTRARREQDADTGVEICTSQRSDARWSAPVRLDVSADTLSSYGHPAVSPDGTWLYFTSDRPGGYGGKDLWRVSLKERASVPENLGDFINTPGDEMFPYVRDDSVLYFASNGHASLGGLDIFRAEMQPSGSWLVTNMGVPVNSSADDFGITFGYGESGFFSSNRGDNRGYDHLYSFMLPDLKIEIGGIVEDLDGYPVDGALIRIVGDDGSIRKSRSKPDGTFSFPLQRGVSYVMMAGAAGYLNAKQEFMSGVEEEDARYEVNFTLASIDKPNVIDNIFYDFDKATLRPESRAALDSMAQVLRDNPRVSIELSAHTDRKGTEAYNIDLSMRRARSVIDYLVAAGIDSVRLTPHGYGKSRPKTVTPRLAKEYPQFAEGTVLDEEFIEQLPDADREIADQINRRTEFKVLSIDYNIY